MEVIKNTLSVGATEPFVLLHISDIHLSEFDENDTSDFFCRTVYYDELCGNGPIAKLRWFWDADECEKKKFAVLGGMAIGAAALGVAAVLSKLLKK